MKRAELVFERPADLAAVAPPEERGSGRDDVRLLISEGGEHTHSHFRDLPYFLRPGDVLVANDSATLAASLPATGSVGRFVLNFSTYYGAGVWLAEPRGEHGEPGPLPLVPGEPICVTDLPGRMIGQYPGLPDLWFVHLEGDAAQVMAEHGSPIRYGYIPRPYPLATYQTVFARVPGSAEMPSAGRPFTPPVLAALKQAGVTLATITVHTGVSSQEVDSDDIEDHLLYPEPFRVPAETARIVNAALADGRRVIAIGTTVVKALETAWDGCQVRPAEGFTRAYIHPARGINVVSGLLTGFHDPVTSHLAMLYAIAGEETIRVAYHEAVAHGYLWHEFGDSHLILLDKPRQLH